MRRRGRRFAFTTTLREIAGDHPGQQYLTDPVTGKNAYADVAARATDTRSLRLVATAKSIQNKLKDFNQDVSTFTSAEMALELVKGVVKVEFQAS